mmetsp:Transcript_10540/g.26403  ORF Transcript_10540/g.26403 Transcript_10540/m.26403 type:complete len:312 (-) Transcript_10540:252-1187(-)
MQPRERQAKAQAGHFGLGVPMGTRVGQHARAAHGAAGGRRGAAGQVERVLHLLRHRGHQLRVVHCRVPVVPNLVDRFLADASPLIADLDRDVRLRLADLDHDGRHEPAFLPRLALLAGPFCVEDALLAHDGPLHGGSQRILHQLKEHVVQVRRNVGNHSLCVAPQLNLRRDPVRLDADLLRPNEGKLHRLFEVQGRRDDSNKVLSLLLQCNVLLRQHAARNPRCEHAVQKRVQLELVADDWLGLAFAEARRERFHQRPMLIHQPLKQLRELDIRGVVRHGRELPQLLEPVVVRLVHPLNVRVDHDNIWQEL